MCFNKSLWLCNYVTSLSKLNFYQESGKANEWRLRQKSLSLYEDFQKKDGTEEETKPFTANRGLLHRFRKSFNLKNTKIIGEAASADEEEAATFQVELKQNYQEGKMRS